PAADLEGAREALEALADQPGGPALAALFLEPLQRRTGRRVPDPFWAALEDWRAATGVPVVLVESASAGWRSGAGPLLASELPFTPDRLVWAAGRVAFAHAPEDAPFPAAGWDADPLALVQAHHALRAARDLALDGLVAAARLEDALAPLRGAGAEERGTGALRFAVLGDAAGPVAALLEARGIHPARVGGVLRFAPPLDAPPERFDALQTALERAAREHLS
ncbi:MAG TPA: hypothetical protein RMI62_06080, partial [Polyangiaceae bacterium LLY-WYZ-15_(1-7)]|nr:hypothetical protein [Polyangiaceae bacterium LLY-WYZ-15_(1-7)]